MGSITVAGVGSGLDLEALVTKLLAAERQPAQTRLDQRQSTLEAQLSAFGQFRSAVEKLRTAIEPLTTLSEFQGRTATVGDETLLSVTPELTAATGSYSIEVLQLAVAQKLAAGPFATADTYIGSGDLTLTVAGNSFTVTIDQGAGTLADIRNAINGAADNTGVAATLITADDGVRLVLTARQTGTANTMTVTQSGGDGGLAQVAALTEVKAAQDAQVSVDGFTYTSPDNVITESVSGLTLNLKAAAPGNPTSLIIDNDTEGSRSRVEEFVSAYNELVKSLRGLTVYDATTRKAGPLNGDSAARNFLNSLRSETVRAYAGNGIFSNLAEIGVTTQVDGSLQVDSTRLSEVLGSGFDEVGKFFSAVDTGLANRLDTLFGQYIDSDGLIASRTDGIQAGIRDIAKAQEALDFRLQKVEERLRRQFTALDALVAQLRATSDFLTRQLDALLPTNQQKSG